MNLKSNCPGCQGETRRVHDSNELREFHPNANASCPACMEFRRHTADERATYHPSSASGEDNRNRSIQQEPPK